MSNESNSAVYGPVVMTQTRINIRFVSHAYPLKLITKQYGLFKWNGIVFIAMK